MDIYENIVIGNFLYGLGLQIGIRRAGHPIPPMCVNLLQQTPLDKRLADVFIANAAVYRLIEFKRAANESDKERSKRKILDAALSSPETAHLKAVSREIHWYIETDHRNDHWTTRSIPYLDFINAQSFIGFEEFIHSTAESAVSEEMDAQKAALCRAYITLVAKLVPDDAGASGALVIFVTSGGQVQYATLQDIKDIFLKNREVIAHQQRMPTQELTRDRSQSKTISRGRSLGHGK